MICFTARGNIVSHFRLPIVTLAYGAGLVLGLLAAAGSVRAENWPGWRGPRGDGSSAESQVPIRWSATQNIAWKTEIPGTGHASPIVWGDRVFLVTALVEEEVRLLLCLDRNTGEETWRRTILHAPLEGKHRLNSYASSTPATDGQSVYVSFLDRDQMLVAAYDFDGNRQWLVRPGGFSSVHGYCSSPVVFGDKLLVNGDHDGDSYLVALNRNTGETVWKVPRKNRTRSYSTPLVREIEGRQQMLISGNRCVASYDPDTGSRLWIIDGPTEQFVASIVFGHGLVYMTAGYPDLHIMAIRPDGRGNVTKTHVVWHHTRGASYVPSPVLVGDYFLLVSDGGIASCFEAKTGERLWQKRIGLRFSASAVTAGGLAYFLSDDGAMTVLRPGVKFDRVAVNELGENSYASPAVSGGQLFLRAEKHLFCIGSDASVAGGY